MTLKSFSLGIVDLLGIMLPGVLWSLLIWYIHFSFPQFLWLDNLSVFSKEISRFFPANQFIVNLSFFLFGSYLIGYMNRLVPPRLLDRLTIPIASIHTKYKIKKAWTSFNAKQKMMPYDFIFKKQSTKLQNLLDESEEFSDDSDRFKQFFLCKRFILQHSPQLWLDAERREAEIRMINGLFYITLSMAIVFMIQDSFSLFGMSILISLLLGIAFRRRKYAEVSFIYSATFIILNDLAMQKKAPANEALKLTE